ncbi:hypothetical protein KsCSTR_27310 [Candidatus Kuenenia stuttgartiensis]|uniref:Uncharacterized protein n=1 Tax=Kuenenia stuttgartiensis TaxID=174633 RepID=A0A6G7GR78_KUEST|nr:hypothetical protein KsCSTR_27310 [Candidatus Kuenenia stuttgartiensis]
MKLKPANAGDSHYIFRKSEAFGYSTWCKIIISLALLRQK